MDFKAILLLCFMAGSSTAEVRELEQCTSTQQRTIYPTVLSCSPRETVVGLNLPNDTFVHVVPGHVTVKRCGASCLNRYCITEPPF
jgi:hypothetical protein